MISQVKGLLSLLLSVIFCCLAAVAVTAPGVLMGDVPMEPEPWRDVWAVLVRAEPALLPQDWNTWQCCCLRLGPEAGKDHSAFVL